LRDAASKGNGHLRSGGLAVAGTRVGTAVLLLVISFALGEVALRLVDRIHPSFIFHDDSYNRFRVKPGSDFYGFPVKPLDTHWNMAGNRLAADEVANFLVARGLVPANETP
jgi:hypothetical protein